MKKGLMLIGEIEPHDGGSYLVRLEMVHPALDVEELAARIYVSFWARGSVGPNAAGEAFDLAEHFLAEAARRREAQP